MSCLTTRATIQGNDRKLVATLVDGDLKISGSNVRSLVVRTLVSGDLSISAQYTHELKVRTGILCPVGLGYEVLWSSEGILLHSENGCFFLEKRS